MLLKLFLICLLVIKFRITSTANPGAAATAADTSVSLVKMSECAAKGGECDETKGRPVCGTDNQTYPTRCHLIRAQCSGHQVSLKHRGSCKGACLASRAYALAHRMTSAYDFIPKCRADGSYAPVQCITNTECWCVDNLGKPIPKTSVRTGKPICKKSKSNTRRSSPGSPDRTKKGCSRADRFLFNTNLVNEFHSEYNRYEFHKISSQLHNPSAHNDNTVLEWKFSAMDLNKNNMLDRQEFRVLKRLVKKVVKPKRCARAFGKLCDIDHDERLSRQEWSNCLSKDDLNLLRGKTTVELHGESDPSMRENEGELGCLADRAASLDDQKSGSQALYIPDCTADGRFQRVQCYRSTDYCWCVHEDTGKYIAGTSTKNQKPDCDSIIPPSRPMKGCPEAKKNEFLKELKEFLRIQIASSGHISANTTKWGTEDEKLATLSFVLLDKNKNKLWERNEWKTFRDLVTSTRTLRKCGKKMPRYCDVNNDKKITLSEWLNCLQTQRIHHGTPKSITNELRPTSQTKLKGPNPLESYLKSD